VLRHLAVLVSVTAQQEVDGMARATSVSVTGPAEVADDDGGYRMLWSKWSCLGGSWWRDDAHGGSMGQGEVGVDGASACSGVLVGVAMPILASLDDMGTSWLGLCWSLLGQGLVPACSVERGEAPGHAEVNQRGVERRVAWRSGMSSRHGLDLVNFVKEQWCQSLALSRGCKGTLRMTQAWMV
jgi:hypothetical protein